MSNLIHIADRVLNRPLLITRDKAQVILSVLSGRIGVSAPEASRFEGESEPQRDKDGNVKRDVWGKPVPKPYRASNGVAIITIVGSLVNRGAWVGASSGLTSYEGIGHQLKSALADDTIKAVILDMQTPGGEAVGAFETAELVRQLAAKKRTVAVVNGMAASAGYAIASAASEIVTTETGLSGSIGVVMLHADYSRALANEGIEPTLIFAGAHKVDGNPFEPLSDDVKNDLQKEVGAFYDLFLKTVSKGRGSKLTAAAARKTEARIFMGQDAVEAGLADRVGSFDTVLSELTRAVTPSGGRSTSQTRRSSMSETNGAPAAEADAGIPKAERDAAIKAAESKGCEAGAKAANDRIVAALGADGVKGDATRMAAALDLAMKSPAMSGEDVAAFVVSNVSSSAPSDPAAAYEASRVAGAGLAQPAPAKTSRRASLNSGDVYAARRQSVKEG